MRIDLHVHYLLKLNGFCLFILLCQPTFAQEGQFLEVDTTKYIVWDEDRPLTWEDYPKIGSRQSTEFRDNNALTAVTHSIRGGFEKGAPNFEVYVLFKIEDSWTTTREDEQLFAHEKLHFDIAELYGRKLRKQIAAMGSQKVQNLTEYRKKIKYLLDEFKIKSMDYDEATLHGSLLDKQEEWQSFVSSELQRLHKYN